MYRIRFHGRGGQGVKTASRMLGTALFSAGFEVQDAPRYGAERRGAPIFAYVRAAHGPIHERGVIDVPDLVLVADDTLLGLTAAGALDGADARTVVVVATAEEPNVWQQRLRTAARLVRLPGAGGADLPPQAYVGAAAVGAAARLLGVVSRDSLSEAVRAELAGFAEDVVDANAAQALAAFDALADEAGAVGERAAQTAGPAAPPPWIDLPRDAAAVAAPAIYRAATSVNVRTGLWRTVRPVLDKSLCKRCTWVCGSYCPDGVISVDADGYPMVDLDHCKGCMVCVVQCPSHALVPVPEADAMRETVA